MSIPWSTKGNKTTPVSTDELMILDSEDVPGPTQNKLVTIGDLLAGELVARAILGLTGDQVVAASAPVVWDKNSFFGDATKIVDEGSGIIRLHNGVFFVSSRLALDIGGGGVQSGVLAWESSANVGGPFVPLTDASEIIASYSKGDASETTQPQATGIVDATAADVFVRAVLTVTNSSTILNASSGAGIVSFGTSVVANTPLNTKGDFLTHNGINEQREPIGTAGQQPIVDPSKPNGWGWIDSGELLIADQILGVQGSTFDVSFPAREHLRIQIDLEGIGGNLNAEFNFNDDFTGNYAFRREENMTTLAPETSAVRVPLDPSTVDTNVRVILEVFNKLGKVKSFFSKSVSVDGPSAATLPATQEANGNWHDNAQVIKLNLNTTINEFAVGSRVRVYASKD